jgi:hypothetical protein
MYLSYRLVRSEEMIADDTRIVLLGLRVVGSADADRLVEAVRAMSSQTVEVPALLGRLESAGLVEERRGRWRLTDEGRAEGERLLRIELDSADARSDVTNAYARVLDLNGPLLRVCTDWQLRDANPSSLIFNDHTDEQFDQAVLARHARIHERAVLVCDDLTRNLDRFGCFAVRFNGAFDRIISGDAAALDAPTPDSYHSVWFQLHENLIATLGVDRSKEPLPDTSSHLPD